MKRCFSCKEIRVIEAFALNKGRYDGRQNLCRICKSARDKIYYLSHKQKHYERVRDYIMQNKRKLYEYFKLHPCIDCGESNPIVLELDHVKGKKVAAISSLLYAHKSSWTTIENEINKCVVRCANCHRIKTAKELKWYSFLDSS